MSSVSILRSQQESPCQDPARNWTTRRSPDDRKETQTAVAWSCLPFIRSGQTILQGTVKGGRRPGRQRKRWEDNIRKRTGLEFGKSQRAMENREKWRKLIARSSVVPQRPSRLRDRWWWRWWNLIDYERRDKISVWTSPSIHSLWQENKTELKWRLLMWRRWNFQIFRFRKQYAADKSIWYYIHLENTKTKNDDVLFSQRYGMQCSTAVCTSTHTF